MADSAVTPYVFLDTEVFRTHQLDLQSPNIRRLVRLAVEGPLRLLLTTVTKGEVMDDLKESRLCRCQWMGTRSICLTVNMYV